MTNRSRLAELFGVDEDEEYTVKGDNDIVYRIHNGERQYKNLLGSWHSVCSEYSLVALINDPSLIVRKPRFTDEEMTVLRWLHKHGKLKKCKFVFGDPYAETGGKYNLTGNIVDYLLKPGEIIDLDEMFKEDTGND